MYMFLLGMLAGFLFGGAVTGICISMLVDQIAREVMPDATDVSERAA